MYVAQRVLVVKALTGRTKEFRSSERLLCNITKAARVEQHSVCAKFVKG